MHQMNKHVYLLCRNNVLALLRKKKCAVVNYVVLFFHACLHVCGCVTVTLWNVSELDIVTWCYGGNLFCPHLKASPNCMPKLQFHFHIKLIIHKIYFKS